MISYETFNIDNERRSETILKSDQCNSINVCTEAKENMSFDYQTKGIRFAFLNIHFIMLKIEEICYYLMQINITDILILS